MPDATTMSLTLHDLTPEMATAVIALVNGDAPAKPATKPAAKPAAEKKAPAKKAEPKKEEKPKEEPEAAPTEVTREAVKAALTAYRAEHGQDAAVVIIKKYGKSISSIPEENFQQVLDDCAKGPSEEEEWD